VGIQSLREGKDLAGAGVLGMVRPLRRCAAVTLLCREGSLLGRVVWPGGSAGARPEQAFARLCGRMRVRYLGSYREPPCRSAVSGGASLTWLDARIRGGYPFAAI
jgi:hypothetical protein